MVPKPERPGVRGGAAAPPEGPRAVPDPIEQVFPSTNFVWRKVRVSRSSPGGRALPAGQVHLRGLRRRDPRKALTLVIWARDADLQSFEVKTRGVTWRFDGGTYLFDVMTQLNNWL